MTGDALRRLESARILAVIVIDSVDHAAPLAHALRAGGIPCAEVTLRTPEALTAISAMAQIDGFLVGAGTVISAEQVDRCADAGAQFIVSPGFDDDVIERAHDRGLDVVPGVATATEVQRATRAGLDVVKFFPADRLGGLASITALAAPFPDMRFIPSGGVGPTNMREYLDDPAVMCVSGSWMATRDLIAAERFTEIERLSAEATR